MAVSKRRAILFVPLAIFLGAFCLLVVAELFGVGPASHHASALGSPPGGCGEPELRIGIPYDCGIRQDWQPPEVFESATERILGIGFAYVMVISHSIYIYRSVKGRAQPQRLFWMSISIFLVSWFVIHFFGSNPIDAQHALHVSVLPAVTSCIIWLLSFKSVAKARSRFDVVVPAISIAGFITWWILWAVF